MEIKDPQAIYSFLGNLSWFGNIAFFILLAIIVAFVALNISEKIFDSTNKTLKRNTVLLVGTLVIVCGMVLKNEANNSKNKLKEANAIKSYLIDFKLRYKSLKGLANDIVFSSEDTLCKGESGCILARIKKIKDIIDEYPEEFIIVPVNDAWDNKTEYNVEGLELIDDEAAKAIDSSVAIMLPFYKSKIINYLQYNKIDTISYGEILDKIDGRCHANVLDMVIINSDGLLVPINKDNPSLFLNHEVENRIHPSKKIKNH